MPNVVQIDGEWTVNDVLRSFPDTVTVFKRFGIDSCCGGPLTLATAAGRHATSLAALLSALRESGER